MRFREANPSSVLCQNWMECSPLFQQRKTSFSSHRKRKSTRPNFISLIIICSSLIALIVSSRSDRNLFSSSSASFVFFGGGQHFRRSGDFRPHFSPLGTYFTSPNIAFPTGAYKITRPTKNNCFRFRTFFICFLLF